MLLEIKDLVYEASDRVILNHINWQCVNRKMRIS